jgi:hypothetical protein
VDGSGGDEEVDSDTSEDGAEVEGNPRHEFPFRDFQGEDKRRRG